MHTPEPTRQIGPTEPMKVSPQELSAELEGAMFQQLAEWLAGCESGHEETQVEIESPADDGRSAVVRLAELRRACGERARAIRAGRSRSN